MLHQVELDDGAILLDVDGAIDARTAESFMDHLDDLLERGQTRLLLRLDRASVTSIGACALLAVATRARERGASLVLVAPSEPIARALEKWRILPLLSGVTANLALGA